MASIYDYNTSSGASVVPQVSGASNVGSTASYFDYGYFNHLVVNDASGSFVPSGLYVLKAGDTMTGNLVMSGTTAIQVNNISDNGRLLAITANTSGLSATVNAGTFTMSSTSDKLQFQSSSLELSGASTIWKTNNSANNILMDQDGGVFVNAQSALSNINLTNNPTSGNITLANNPNAGVATTIQLHYSGTINTSGSIIPFVSGVDNLGSPTKYWNNIYVNNLSSSGQSVIISGTSLGSGFPVFAGKVGTNLTFNSISGAGAAVVSSAGGLITVTVASQSGTALTTPNPTQDRGLVTWSGSTGQGLRNNALVIDASQNLIFSGNTSFGTLGFAGGSGSSSAGLYSLAFGFNVAASGDYSQAFGSSTKSLGTYTYSEGSGAIASGLAAHAEGSNTQAIGSFSHAQGQNTEASGNNSTSTGFFTVAAGFAGTAMGAKARAEASGSSIITDGDLTVTKTNSIANSLLIQFSGGANFAPNTNVSGNNVIALNLSGTNAIFSSTVTAQFVSGTTASIGTLGFGSATGTTLNATTVSGITVNSTNFSGSIATALTLSGTTAKYSQSVFSALISGTNISGTTASIDTVNAQTINASTILLSGNSVIVSGTNLGAGTKVFNDSKLGNNLQFNTLAGAGNVSVTLASNLITISGASVASTGNVSGPATSTDRAIATWSGTGGNSLLNNAPVTIASNGRLKSTSDIVAIEISGSNIASVSSGSSALFESAGIRYYGNMAVGDGLLAAYGGPGNAAIGFSSASVGTMTARGSGSIVGGAATRIAMSAIGEGSIALGRNASAGAVGAKGVVSIGGGNLNANSGAMYLSDQMPRGTLNGVDDTLYVEFRNGIVTRSGTSITNDGFGNPSIGTVTNPYSGVHAGNIPSAWVTFSGAAGGPTIYNSFNVQTVVRVSEGNYMVYFTNDFPNNNYYADISVQRNVPGVGGRLATAWIDQPWSGAGCLIQTAYWTSISVASLYDPPACTAVFYGARS